VSLEHLLLARHPESITTCILRGERDLCEEGLAGAGGAVKHDARPGLPPPPREELRELDGQDHGLCMVKGSEMCSGSEAGSYLRLIDLMWRITASVSA